MTKKALILVVLLAVIALATVWILYIWWTGEYAQSIEYTKDIGITTGILLIVVGLVDGASRLMK